jgi:hypothetical protein
MIKFNIRGGLWTFVRLSLKNDKVLAKLHLQDESIVLSSPGEAVSACCYVSYTSVKELHGTTETYRS